MKNLDLSFPITRAYLDDYFDIVQDEKSISQEDLSLERTDTHLEAALMALDFERLFQFLGADHELQVV